MQASFHKIEELEQYGINKTDIVKLKTGGYHTIEAVSFLLNAIIDVGINIGADCSFYDEKVDRGEGHQ